MAKQEGVFAPVICDEHECSIEARFLGDGVGWQLTHTGTPETYILTMPDYVHAAAPGPQRDMLDMWGNYIHATRAE